VNAAWIDPTALLSGEQAGSAGLGFVWGWLLIQLTVPSRPSVQRWVVPLVATAALMGAVFVLLDTQAMVISAISMGASAVLHVGLITRLRLQSSSNESSQFIEGESQ